MKPEIETARLQLTPYTLDDVEALVLNAGDPGVARMMASIPLPFTREAALDRIERRACDAHRFTFAIRDRETGEAIGEISAGPPSRDAMPQLGYFLRPAYWGRGLMGEAVSAALDHAFYNLHWPCIDAEAFDENPASAKVLTRIGFEPFGLSTCTSMARTDAPAGTLYRLLRSRWLTPILKTPRLTLRPPVTMDAQRIATLIGEYDVARMLAAVPHPYTLDDAHEWLSGKIEGVDAVPRALDDGSGLIGVVGIAPIKPRVQSLGFWLGKPWWGLGLMSEAVDAVVRWAFEQGGADRIESSAFMDNAGSRQIHRKLGFVEGAESTIDSPARGEPAPSILLSLTREDWTPIP